MEHGDLRQLFNTSWTIYRLSPLHHGKDCETLLDNQIALKTYATRLRDHLTGDHLAGLQTSTGATDEGALSKTDTLQDCQWQPISPRSSQSGDGSSGSPDTTFSGILVTLEYENIVYKAAMLADTGSSPNQRTASTSVPLLLTRFPTALRQAFLAFLSTNFDTYYSPLRLPSSFLCAGLETYIDALRAQGGTSANDTVEDVIKELQLTLSFSPSIAPALRSLDVCITRASLAGFLRDQSGSAPKSRTLRHKLRSPLIANLTSYLETHLAMKLDLDGLTSNQTTKQHVRLSKIACAAFVLGSEGRVKLVVTADRGAGDEDDSSEGQTRGSVNKPAFEAGGLLLRSLIQKAVLGDHSAT